MIANKHISGSAGSTERIKHINQVQGMFDNIQGLKMYNGNNVNNYGVVVPSTHGEGSGQRGAPTSSSKNSRTSVSSKGTGAP